MAVAKERVTQATDYVVLEQREFKNDSTGETTVAWVEAGTAPSTTRTGAVTTVAGDKEGVWRPVPSRNWAEALRTHNETTTKMKIEPVEPEAPF